MWKEFKAFLLRGNVVDLAVAVVIGLAFKAIVDSIVADLITPLLGLILGGVNFAGLSFSVGEAVFTYGNLIQAIINFVIVGFVLFLIVKAANRAMPKPPPPPPAGPTPQEVLLAEIRDLLKKRP